MNKVLTTVKGLKYLTAEVVELDLQLVLPASLEFKAGQFMQFMIGNDLRAYTIAQAPDGSNSLKFCVKFVGNGKGTEFVKNLKVGDSVYLQGPSGSFVVEDLNRNLFFVAGGVGVAPFASMVPYLLKNKFSKSIYLLFGLKREEDVFYYDLFGSLAAAHQNFKFIPMLSDPQAHWPGEVGRVTAYLDVHYTHYDTCVFYICGKPELVQESRRVLLKHGHPVEDIKTELFTGV